MVSHYKCTKCHGTVHLKTILCCGNFFSIKSKREKVRFVVLNPACSQCSCIRLAKKFLWFLSKNKRHIFHFHQELYWTTYALFCSTTFCHFSGNFIIPSSPEFLFFWAKNCSRWLLQSYRELKFFSLKEFCKDRNKWKSEGSMSGEYGGGIRISQPSCNDFCLVIKETCGLALS